MSTLVQMADLIPVGLFPAKSAIIHPILDEKTIKLLNGLIYHIIKYAKIKGCDAINFLVNKIHYLFFFLK